MVDLMQFCAIDSLRRSMLRPWLVDGRALEAWANGGGA
jgi:hypothetical protein